MPRPSPKAALFIVLLLSLLGGAGLWIVIPRPPPLNLVLITIDTLRADRLGCYGYSRNTSPNIDELAASSTLFTNAHVQGGWTLPSMTSLMLSLPPHNHQVYKDNVRLPEAVPTLAERLREAGYQTFAVQSNPFLQSKLGFDRGFTNYFFSWDAVATRVSSIFKQQIERLSPKPFFGYVHFMDPHLPYRSVKYPFGEPYTGRLQSQDKPFEQLGVTALRAMIPQLDERDWQFLRDRYDQEVAFADEGVARVLHALENKGLMDKTIVVLLADHGEEFFEHGGFEHGHSLYREITHVPLIIRDPRSPVGTRRDELVRLIDVYPTVLSMLGLPRAGHAAGVDLTSPGLPELPVLSDGILTGLKKTSLQNGRWKVIRTSKTMKEKLWELFDMTADPGETKNLAEGLSNAYDLADARNRLDSEEARGERYQVKNALAPKDRETIRSLETLGYLD